MSSDNKSEFWANLLTALETEPRKADFVRGVSGIEHPVIAAGVDDGRRRLPLVSGEHDARSAAIAQLDIQRVIESVQVVVMRPIAANLGDLAKEMVGFFGGATLAQEMFVEKMKALPGKTEMQELINQNFTRYTSGFDIAKINWVAQIMQLIQQLAMIEIEVSDGQDGKPPTGTFSFEKLASLDPTELDRHLGVCPIPLYDLNPSEAEIIQSGRDHEAIRDILRRHQILQFFFPSADHLALGLVDRGLLAPGSVLNELSKAPEVGHPFGPPELTSAGLPIGDTIEALEEKGVSRRG